MRGSIIATCGHQCADTVSVRYGGEECDSHGFHPSVSHVEYCALCAADARTWPEYIANDAEEALWLAGSHPVQTSRFRATTAGEAGSPGTPEGVNPK